MRSTTSMTEAKKEPSFFDNLTFIQKQFNPKVKITDDLRTKLDATNFPPRYLLDIYLSSNPNLSTFINKYINKDYNVFYKLTVTEAVEIIREYNLHNSLYNPMFNKKVKDDFNDKLKTLRETFQKGLGKQELEIFMLAADRLPDYERDQIFKNSKTDIKKSAKTTHKEVEELRVTKYTTYRDYLVKTLNIKEKNSACEKCKLKSNNSIYFETNMVYGDDNHADVLILSDQPSDGIIMRPESYKVLEQFIKHYKFDSLKYIISNIVLCESPDKITKCNVDDCYSQINSLINVSKPSVILALGSSVCERLGLESTGIVNRAGCKAQYKGYDVIVSVHPSYLIKNQNQDAYQIFGTAFQEVYNILYPPDELDILNNGRKKPGDIICEGKIYGAKVLPKKFYTSDWVLIDIFKDGFKTIDHTFRNVHTNEKVTKKIPTSHYEYYYIMKDPNSVSRPFLNARDIICKKGPWKFSPDVDLIEKSGKTILYEGSTDLSTKAAIDYYYFSELEEDYLPQVFRYDIEHDMENFHGTDLSAPYKVTYISAEYNNEYYLWILDSVKFNVNEISAYKTNSGEKVKLIINEFAGDESLMLQSFWHTFFTLDPDAMTAWNNHGFDYPYLINRSKRIPYQKNDRFNFANFDGCMSVIDMFQMMDKNYNVKMEGDDWGHHSLTGVIVTDSMALFEEQWQNSVESYSLDFISQMVLKLSKKPFPGKNATREEWIEYNLWDTELLSMIDNKLQNTNFRFFLMKITTNTWNAIGFALGIVEGLSLFHSKKANNVLRTYRDPKVFNNKFITQIVGGFTQNGKGGLYRLLVDYDGASMYPSFMNTFNIGPNTLRMTVSPEHAKMLMTKKYNPSTKVQVAWSEMETVRGLQYEDTFITIAEVRQIIDERNYIITPSGAIYCSIEEEKSLFFDILESLGKNRTYNKDRMYNADGSMDMSKYNKQLALKISSNAFFGVYLFSKFMFFNTSIGSSITMGCRLFIKTIMYMIEKYYGHIDMTLDEVVDAIDVLKVQDLEGFKYCFYADTDGTVITLQDIIPDTLTLEEQLARVEEELKKINPHIKEVVENLYAYFNKKDTDYRLMKFKEDWVADKGIYYDKHKRYAIHLVREGGKPKDELLFRGIQVRRSDSPKIVKEELSNVLNILLTGKNITIQDIFDYLDKVEDKFYGLCKDRSMALGKPVKYSKADHQYKKRPYQVEAMLFWNALHKQNDFTVGSKGYLYNVQYINYEYIMQKFGLTEAEIHNIKETFETKAIAIPQDYDKVPEYIEIDSNETVEKVFVIPYTNILEPIMQETVISDIPLIDFL